MVLSKLVRTGEGCGHPGHQVTVYCGLERSVCDACGEIFIRRVAEGDPGVLFQDRDRAHPLITSTASQRQGDQ